jgi:hypothetical protein
MRKVEWVESERFPYYDGTWAGPQAVLGNLLVPLSDDWDLFSAKAHEFVAERSCRLTWSLFRHIQGNRTIIFGRVRPRLDGEGRQAREVQNAHPTPPRSRSEAELKIAQSPALKRTDFLSVAT